MIAPSITFDSQHRRSERQPSAERGASSAGQASFSNRFWRALTLGLGATACVQGACANPLAPFAPSLALDRPGQALQGPGAYALLPAPRRALRDVDGAHDAQQTAPRRTIYFLPQGGVCNQLRGIFAAAQTAHTERADLKLVINAEAPDSNAAVIRSNYDNLLAQPRFHWVDSFADMDMSEFNAQARIEPADDGVVLDGSPSTHCTVYFVDGPQRLQQVLDTGWHTSKGEATLCLSSIYAFNTGGERHLRGWYRAMRPAEPVQKSIEHFKSAVSWDEFQWVGVHVRRTDLSLLVRGEWKKSTDLIPLSDYVEHLHRLTDPTPGLQSAGAATRILVASDDPEAKTTIASQFPPNLVTAFSKPDWGRANLAGLEGAVAELTVLSHCPILLGTYFSSFSEAARHMGHGYFLQVMAKNLSDWHEDGQG